jgi:hypothetical protein
MRNGCVRGFVADGFLLIWTHQDLVILQHTRCFETQMHRLRRLIDTLDRRWSKAWCRFDQRVTKGFGPRAIDPVGPVGPRVPYPCIRHPCHDGASHSLSRSRSRPPPQLHSATSLKGLTHRSSSVAMFVSYSSSPSSQLQRCKMISASKSCATLMSQPE